MLVLHIKYLYNDTLQRSTFNTVLFVVFLILFTSLALSEPRDKMLGSMEMASRVFVFFFDELCYLLADMLVGIRVGLKIGSHRYLKI